MSICILPPLPRSGILPVATIHLFFICFTYHLQQHSAIADHSWIVCDSPSDILALNLEPACQEVLHSRTIGVIHCISQLDITVTKCHRQANIIIEKKSF